MNKVSRPLAMLGALAAAIGAFPASARDLVVMPKPQAPTVDRPKQKPGLQLSRKQRRILAARIRGSGKPNGNKLSRKAAEGKL